MTTALVTERETTFTKPSLRPLPQACRFCGAKQPPAPVAICEECLGPLEPVYDPDRPLPDAGTIGSRGPSLWRYREWLPFLDFTERNHYDRLVHFLFGLLLAVPIREIFLRIVQVRGFWSYYLPLDVAMAFSMLYELIEWAAALVFGGELGVAYLGTQGDPWDAQKDMGLATLGALITLLAVALSGAASRARARTRTSP